VSGIGLLRLSAVFGALRGQDGRAAKRLPLLPMLPHDLVLFIKSARTDAKVERLRRDLGSRAAFDATYRESNDPWASASPRYRYQWLKYDKLIALLPRKNFGRALDLGCGLGLLSQKLTQRADHVLGIDIAPAAIDIARQRGAGFSNLAFESGDILDLSPSLNGCFDLVVVADVLYYLSPLDGGALEAIVKRIADLLTPGGTCLLANHFFFSADRESRMSRRIHTAFSDCPRFAVTSEHRRAFFLATLFSERTDTIAA